MVTTSYCSLPGGYCSLLVVTVRNCLFLLVPTFSMNDTLLINSKNLSDPCKQELLHFIQKCHPEVFYKIDVHRNFAKLSASFLAGCNFTKKETLAHVFCCEFCKISKNTFSHRISPMAVSGY